MVKDVPHDAIAYAEDKTAFLESHADQWLTDHRDAETCAVWERIATDVNRHFGDVFELDSRLQESYCHGVAYQPELEDRVGKLIGRWVALAERMIARGEEFERKGYHVEQWDELRHNAGEAKATLDPKGELTAPMAELRDRALAEHTAGKSIEGIAG